VKALIALTALAVAGLAGCGSQAATVITSQAPAAETVPLATSLATVQGVWAIVPMGEGTDTGRFWQLFVRPAGPAATWSLATPPAVADNGGLVAAGTPSSLLIGFRPSQGLAFSPLATSTDTGKNWAPSVLPAVLADVPDALSLAPAGTGLALLADGTVETSSSAGTWSRLTTEPALAASAAGRRCGLTGVSAMSFSQNGLKVVAGSCSRPDVAGVFTETASEWQLIGPNLGITGSVQVLRLAGSAALLRGGTSLYAAWYAGGRWTVSPPLAGVGQVDASGFGAGGSAWVLPGTGRPEVISGPGGTWQALPAAPAGTAVLAPGTPVAALSVSGAGGTALTVWRLSAGFWAKDQVIDVPIGAGSSG
jgi:hypothetical protein